MARALPTYAWHEAVFSALSDWPKSSRGPQRRRPRSCRDLSVSGTRAVTVDQLTGGPLSKLTTGRQPTLPASRFPGEAETSQS
jgi:hypothetical protein